MDKEKEEGQEEEEEEEEEEEAAEEEEGKVNHVKWNFFLRNCLIS